MRGLGFELRGFGVFGLFGFSRVFGMPGFAWAVVLLLLLFCSCGSVGRSGLGRDRRTDKVAEREGLVLRVLVDKGFRLERLEGGEIRLVEDESCVVPYGYALLFGRNEGWRLEGLKASLLGMGALRVEIER